MVGWWQGSWGAVLYFAFVDKVFPEGNYVTDRETLIEPVHFDNPDEVVF